MDIITTILHGKTFRFGRMIVEYPFQYIIMVYMDVEKTF